MNEIKPTYIFELNNNCWWASFVHVYGCVYVCVGGGVEERSSHLA